MKKILSSGKIFIKQSSIAGAGRGVYTNRDIKKGEIIEICPVIEIPDHDMTTLRENILITYIFFSGKNKQRLLLALGFGSAYNHSYKSNATYNIKISNKTIEFVAIKDIQKNTEITTNYNGKSSKNTRPLWFE